jgi:peptidoglycan/LPS O-acetylase OafA/YrhL
VVVTHVALATELPEAVDPDPPLWWRIMALLVGVTRDGTTAVLVFFVLSGLVLVRPFLRRHTAVEWAAYYPRRLVRLYLPVWGSIALALAWFTLIPRRNEPGLTPWIVDHVEVIHLGDVLRTAALLKSASFNSPLWSLHWEILFSLLLPCYVLVVARSRPLRAVALIAIALVAQQLGTLWGRGDLVFLTQFLVGAALATQVERIRDWGRTVTAGQGIALVVAAFAFTQLPWHAPVLAPAGPVLRLAGGALTVVAALAVPGALRVLDHHVVQWLGRISFSLYLVHEPLVVTLRLAVPATANFWVLLVLAVPMSLALAHGFYRVVEYPAHVLARWVGMRSRVLVSDRA